MSALPKVSQIAFDAQIENLQEMMAWVRAQAAPAGLSNADLKKVEIAMEEVLVNVIQHAYREKNGNVELVCQVYPNDRVEFLVKDKGPPFNPLLQEGKSLNHSSIDDIEEGGFGIFMMKRLIDAVHYERHHPYNVLILIKKSK